MEYFKTVPRPERNRRKIGDEELDWDTELEAALMETLNTGNAIEADLALFHSSPAKGRLWARGYALRHRVNQDRRRVAAWIEKVDVREDAELDAGENFTGELF